MPQVGAEQARISSTSMPTTLPLRTTRARSWVGLSITTRERLIALTVLLSETLLTVVLRGGALRTTEAQLPLLPLCSRTIIVTTAALMRSMILTIIAVPLRLAITLYFSQPRAN